MWLWCRHLQHSFFARKAHLDGLMEYAPLVGVPECRQPGHINAIQIVCGCGAHGIWPWNSPETFKSLSGFVVQSQWNFVNWLQKKEGFILSSHVSTCMLSIFHLKVQSPFPMGSIWRREVNPHPSGSVITFLSEKCFWILFQHLDAEHPPLGLGLNFLTFFRGS